MRRWSVAIVMFTAFSLPWFTASVEAKKDDLPRLPGAVLLLGYPPANLAITTEYKTSKLQEEGTDGLITPSISADGLVVASARVAAGEPSTSRSRLIVSTYSMADNKWTEYKDLEIFRGTVAISPDGSKLACVTRKMADAPSGLHVLDLKTGKVTVGPELWEMSGTDISWSPDGRRLAFDIGGKADPTPLRAIYILNVETGSFSKIGQGVAPSWSPSGEWIAYLDYFPDHNDAKLGVAAGNPNRVSLMRPDGTDSKVLLTYHRLEALMVAPVWSPDSKTILINRLRDIDKDTFDIYMLDLATLKLTKKFKNTPPVYAWVEAK